MTKAEAISEHRKMYRWIADETRKKKSKVTEKEYFDYHNIPYEDRPFNRSYACHYDMRHGKCRSLCLV